MRISSSPPDSGLGLGPNGGLMEDILSHQNNAKKKKINKIPIIPIPIDSLLNYPRQLSRLVRVGGKLFKFHLLAQRFGQRLIATVLTRMRSTWL